MKAEAISPVILLNPTDNVGVARKAIAKGTDMTTDGGW